jgi:DNA-binding MarR family transcriptional regulator
VFSPNLFSDPAWDIMLTLFLAQLRQRRMAASDLSSATAVPLTTTHRWIDTLEQKGWLRRSPDPLDQRRVFVQLSERGSAAMGVWISDWIESRQKRVHDDCPQDVPRRSGCQDAS